MADYELKCTLTKTRTKILTTRDGNVETTKQVPETVETHALFLSIAGSTAFLFVEQWEQATQLAYFLNLEAEVRALGAAKASRQRSTTMGTPAESRRAPIRCPIDESVSTYCIEFPVKALGAVVMVMLESYELPPRKAKEILGLDWKNTSPYPAPKK